MKKGWLIDTVLVGCTLMGPIWILSSLYAKYKKHEEDKKQR